MAAYNALNPIRDVNGAYIPIPSGYTYNRSDVSSSDAGRTEDTTMHKLLLGACVHIGLEWSFVSPDEASEIMNAFAPEYFSVQFLDVDSGQYKTSVFYCGDKTATMSMTGIGPRYTVSFNIIERTAH